MIVPLLTRGATIQRLHFSPFVSRTRTVSPLACILPPLGYNIKRLTEGS
jgi:hypothetical protein